MRSVSIFFYIAINLKGLLHSICLTSKIRRLFNFFERHYLHWPWWWWPSWHQPCCLRKSEPGEGIALCSPQRVMRQLAYNQGVIRVSGDKRDLWGSGSRGMVYWRREIKSWQTLTSCSGMPLEELSWGCWPARYTGRGAFRVCLSSWIVEIRLLLSGAYSFRAGQGPISYAEEEDGADFKS